MDRCRFCFVTHERPSDSLYVNCFFFHFVWHLNSLRKRAAVDELVLVVDQMLICFAIGAQVGVIFDFQSAFDIIEAFFVDPDFKLKRFGFHFAHVDDASGGENSRSVKLFLERFAN